MSGWKTVGRAIGGEVAAARRRMEWTQTDLSVVLRRRGLMWSPAIVSLVENGDRRLQFTETVVLARVLSPAGLRLEGLASLVPAVELEDVP